MQRDIPGLGLCRDLDSNQHCNSPHDACHILTPVTLSIFLLVRPLSLLALPIYLSCFMRAYERLF
jgi:hypothetical protein